MRIGCGIAGPMCALPLQQARVGQGGKHIVGYQLMHGASCRRRAGAGGLNEISALSTRLVASSHCRSCHHLAMD